jgi:phenylacetate-CoA ligase
MFWHQKMETLDRPALEALQLKRLRKPSAEWRRCRFIARKFLETGVKPEKIKSAADVRAAAVHHRGGFAGELPDGLLAVPRDEALRLHTSSGTTGKPKALFFSRRDVDARRT